MDDWTVGAGARPIHIPDDGFRYPVGTRVNIDRAASSSVELGVRLSPDGAWRVVDCARTEHQGVAILSLALEPVRRA